METSDNTKGRKKKWLLLLLLLLFFLFCLLFYLFKPKPQPKNPTPLATSSSEIKIVNKESPQPEKIVKCQNTVVTPKVTIELYTYVSSSNIRFDYRSSAITDADSFKTQILSDGKWLYFWNPAMDFGDGKAVNPPGYKVMANLLDYSIDMDKLGTVESFKDGQVSGDRLCNTWDDVDPVFSVPSDYEFINSDETQTKIKSDLDKICQVCGEITDSTVELTCKKNLGCY